MNIKILIPVFNDWDSLNKLLEEINLIINDTIVLLIWLICTGYFIYICFLRSIKDY